MADSVLKGVFREFTLSYQVPTGGTTTDEFGNPRPVTEDASLIVTLDIQPSFFTLERLEGADVQLLRTKGACVSPAEFPTGVGLGATFSLELGGVPGTLTILQIGKSALEVLDPLLGQEFIAEWRAS